MQILYKHERPVMKQNTAKNRTLAALADRLGSAVCASFLAGSLAFVFMSSFKAGVSMPFSAACAGAACFLLAFACSSGYLTAGTLLAAAAAVLISVHTGHAPWAELVDIISAFSGEEMQAADILSEHSIYANVLTAVILGSVCYAFSRMQGGVYPSLALTLVINLEAWYASETFLPGCMLAALAALAALFARSLNPEIRWRKVLPAALIAAIIATAAVPPAGTVWQPMADAARKVREIVDAYFRFNTPRTGYTVAMDGYQPMGDRLGGPASPSAEDVMAVETDISLLLRGSIKSTYLGYGWTDDSVNNRYLYISPASASFRSALFGSSVYNGIQTAGAFSDADIRVVFLNEGSSSLFVPDILSELTAPLELAVYFNDTGEVFLTRDVTAGDAYSASGLSPIHGEALENLIMSMSEAADPRYEAIRSKYTTLPEGIERGVYTLTREVVSGSQTPYRAATAICEHLKNNYRYDLNVPYPPYGSDFVSYFLLNTKVGYCTYFASAMAVMCRMVGLPTRYVEGYLVRADESGVTTVTGESAHAWVEVYFRGAGWIAFDPTAGLPGSAPGNGSGDISSNDPGQEPAPDPTPEPTPEPTPSPEPEDNPSAEPSPGPQDPDTPEATPTPEPDESPEDDNGDGFPEPTSEPDQTLGSPSGNNEPFPWAILTAILAFLLIGLLLYLRERATRPVNLVKAEKTDEGKLMIWYKCVLDALECTGLAPRTGETPAAAAERLVAEDASWEPYLLLAEITAACRYSESDPNIHALSAARRAYDCVLEHMDLKARTKWFLRRMARGIGDWRRIPS